MDIFTISSSLVLSSVLRLLIEGNTIGTFVDSLLVGVSIQWMESSWKTLIIVVSTLISLAFYETRAEYLDSKGNVREIDPENVLKSTDIPTTFNNITVQHSSTKSTSAASLCPIRIFKSLAFTPETSLPLHYISDESNEKTRHRSSRDENEPNELYGKPVLFPCLLKHRRLIPFKDSFQHSYLYVGIPVGLHACYYPILCIDQPLSSKSKWPFRRAWFNIRSQDYAIRGGAKMSLAQKLREYLLSEGADPSEWAYAYMLTVPSVNGQVDNPLGFWYLYNSDRELTAVIPELNTSYGERRMWLVRQALPPKPTQAKIRSSPYTFRGYFKKDIHVSPFMPSSGGYTIDTNDPCATPLNRLEILVTLTKAEGGPLLVTRVTSSGPGLDASVVSMWEKISFLMRWCLVPTTTIMTYRILSQAARIYLKAPRFWTRPEPIKTALGKPARVIERTLERSFRLILKAAVESYPSPISVIYSTPGEHSRKSETFNSIFRPPDKDAESTSIITPPPSPVDNNSSSIIILQVISPIFYSRFFHYQSEIAAFTSELLDNIQTRTLWSSNPALLVSIFDSSAEATPTPTEAIIYPSSSNRWHWWFLSSLRTAPIATNYPRSTPYKSFSGTSSMDRWVLQHCSSQEVKAYRRALLRVFLGEWIGGATIGPLKRFSDDLEPFGMSRDAVLRVYDLIIKSITIITAVNLIRVPGTDCNVWIVGVVGWIATGVNLWACLKAVA